MSHLPSALRLIGFSETETALFEAHFAGMHQPSFLCLSEDSLQEPDLLLVNGESLKALAQLSSLHPGPALPALIIGRPLVEVEWPYLKKPLNWDHLAQHLGILLAARADAIAHMSTGQLLAVADRRRRIRPDVDLGSSQEYQTMRRAPLHGDLLLVDKNEAFCHQLNHLLPRFHLHTAWVNGHDAALTWCQQQKVAVVMINTGLCHLDPYQLCRDLKQRSPRLAVVFLVGQHFDYDANSARVAGADGMLNKPLAASHVLHALKKLTALHA